jgi:hypothetical protein
MDFTDLDSYSIVLSLQYLASYRCCCHRSLCLFLVFNTGNQYRAAPAPPEASGRHRVGDQGRRPIPHLSPSPRPPARRYNRDP